MSSSMQLKARSLKRAQKKSIRHQNAKPRLDEDDSKDGYGFLPTPSELNHEFNQKDGGRDGTKFRKNKSKKSNMDGNTQTSITKRHFEKQKGEKAINLAPFKKDFWAGPAGEDPPSDILKQLRKEIGVVVRGPLQQCPSPVLTLDDLHLPSSFRTVLSSYSLQIKSPSAVQKQCWPVILTGANVLVIAPTGSGKTLTYALPLIPHIQAQLEEGSSSVQPVDNVNRTLYPVGLVIVPTRELAIQVAQVFKYLRKSSSIFAAAVYGGQDKDEQMEALFRSNGTKTNVLVATPGRLLDYLSHTSRTVSLEKVTYLVIDEADRMLAMGFMDQLQSIYTLIRPDKQAVLVSATFPGKLREVAGQWIPNCVTVRCNTMDFPERERGGREKTKKDNEKQQEKENKDESGSKCDITDSHKENSDDKGDIDCGADNSSSSPTETHWHDLDWQTGKKTNRDTGNDDEEDGNRKKSKKTNQSTEKIIESENDSSSSSGGSSGSSSRSSNNKEASQAPLPRPAISVTISKTVQQKVHVCAAHKKPRLILKYIETCRTEEKEDNPSMRQPGAMIIFCNKIATLKFLKEFFNKQSISASVLHGQLPQKEREATLLNFRAGKVNNLIATDVAARGIHIKRLKYVINYDFPTNLEQYCHRVGRTGRQGEVGYSYSLLTRNLGPMTKDLISLLQSCDQMIEPNLQQLSSDFADGLIDGVMLEDGTGDDEE